MPIQISHRDCVKIVLNFHFVRFLNASFASGSIDAKRYATPLSEWSLQRCNYRPKIILTSKTRALAP